MPHSPIGQRRHLRTALCAILVAMMTPVARGQNPETPPPVILIGPGDAVKVLIPAEKDLSGQFTVDEDGRLTLPMLGVVRVRDRPWSGLRDSLIAAYAQHGLRNNAVTLTPLRRVEVLGEVTKPGQYFADPTVSLAGAVALAGGATPAGDLHHVHVVRNGTTLVESGSIEGLLLKGGVQSGDQIFVDRRSWFERNTALVASIIVSTSGIIVALIQIRH